MAEILVLTRILSMNYDEMSNPSTFESLKGRDINNYIQFYNEESIVRGPISLSDIVKWPEGRTINGKRYGLWVNYHEGNMEEAGNYIDGVKTGAWTTYN